MKIELGKAYKTNKGNQYLIVADVAKIAKARKLAVWDLYDSKLYIAVEITQILGMKRLDADLPRVFNSKGELIHGEGEYLIDDKTSTEGMI